MYYFLIFLLGICVGSFLNVVIDRLPRGESIIKRRSYCESCKKRIDWYDLIPLLSFIILKRRCRHCKGEISYFYPIVEGITGIIFVLIFLIPLKGNILGSFSLSTVFYLFISSLLIVIFFTDLKYGVIPNKIIILALSLSFLYFIFQKDIFLNHLLSSLGAFLFLTFLFVVTKGKGLGAGDIKLVALLGLLVGFPKILLLFYLAFLTGAFVGLILILWGKKSLKDTISFGPFLVLAFFISLFLGDFIISKITPFIT
jgi:prepilin signal peptidase PulO-like enzyme (type II secretory pathway)